MRLNQYCTLFLVSVILAVPLVSKAADVQVNGKVDALAVDNAWGSPVEIVALVTVSEIDNTMCNGTDQLIIKKLDLSQGKALYATAMVAKMANANATWIFDEASCELKSSAISDVFTP